MFDSIINNEGAWRLAFFLGVFLAMLVWEIVAPCRQPEIPKLFRWSNNLGIVVIDTILVRLAFPLLPVGAAVYAAEHSIGLFNVVSLPMVIIFFASLLILDLLIYLQHRVFHTIPWLWRLHRMHHSDLEFDVTTGIRFHPVEIILSIVVKMIAVSLLGVPAIAVLVFEILLNATAVFNHSNVRLPSSMDRLIRWVLVTPDMHRVHHSVIPAETNSNFGFNVPWWDRLFGTYCAQPEDGHRGMTIGLASFRTRRDLRLDQLLVQPLKTPRSLSTDNQ